MEAKDDRAVRLLYCSADTVYVVFFGQKLKVCLDKSICKPSQYRARQSPCQVIMSSV